MCQIIWFQILNKKPVLLLNCCIIVAMTFWHFVMVSFCRCYDLKKNYLWNWCQFEWDFQIKCLSDFNASYCFILKIIKTVSLIISLESVHNKIITLKQNNKTLLAINNNLNSSRREGKKPYRKLKKIWIVKL